jgi:hypothetical protein
MSANIYGTINIWGRVMPMFCDEVEVKLRDRLTPSGIAKIKYPDSKTEAERNDRVNKSALRDKREKLIATLEDICRAGELEYEGNFACWLDEIKPNSMPKHPPLGYHIEPQTYKRLISSTIKIHNTKFKKFVDGDKKWFPEGFWKELACWWSDGDLKATDLMGIGEDNQKITPRTRTDNLARAINAAINAIGKKPSLDELWRYFQNDKDKTGFIEDFDDEKIVWRDTKGIIHDTPKDTFANRLSRVKK